jgi:hypothetical protein
MEVITPWPHMPNLIQLVQGTEHGSCWNYLIQLVHGTEQVLPTMIWYMVVVVLER